MLSRRTRIVLAVLVVTSLTFIILDLRGGDGPLSGLRAVASNVLGGIERAAATVFSPITGAGTWWSSMRDQAAQIDALTAENDRLRTENETFTNDRSRVAALDALLRVASAGQYRFVPAEVIAIGPAQDFSWTVTIDAGKADGIEPDMSVINGQGLVGRVAKVTANTATVVLVVDSSSAVGGRVATTDEIGIVSGTGRQDSLEFALLDPMADVRKGDALVTFGSKNGKPYAPGVPIGEIVDTGGGAGQLTRVVTVRPYVDVSQLSIVGVITEPPREDPRDSVLPKATSLPSIGPDSEPPTLSGGTLSSPSPDASASPQVSATPSDQKETAAKPQPSASGSP